MLGLAACQAPQRKGQIIVVEYIERPKNSKTVDQTKFDYGLLVSEIENYFDYFVSDNVLRQPELVRGYYVSHDYQPHWILTPDISQNVEYLNVLAAAETHGLNRNTYHYDQLATNLENLSFLYFQTGEINYQLWAESEMLLADGLMLLSKHLKQGCFDPLSCVDYYYFIPPNDTVLEPFDVFDADDLEAFFEDLIPSNTPYRALQYEYVKRLEKPEKSRTNKDIDTLNILRVNLERWRWNPLFTDTTRMVYVNIPAFRLVVLQSNSVLMSSKVCVGIRRTKTYSGLYQNYLKNPETTPKPRHNETPILKDAITYLTLNPQWRVPSTIAKNEILRNIQKDPSYLDKMGYHVYRGNVLIDPYSVDWTDVSPTNFPYRIEQSAGEKNAMGKMKFMFPNKFSVYLHDTPSKRDYARQDRAVSHGCVRVENYLELAHILLSDVPKYDMAYLRETIGLNNSEALPLKTVNLFFKTKIPIIIDYKTASINESGELQIFPDVYNRDHLVLDALKNQHLQNSSN